MSNMEQTVQAWLFDLQDLKYRDFQCKLMPTVDPDAHTGAAEICKGLRQGAGSGGIFENPAPQIL